MTVPYVHPSLQTLYHPDSSVPHRARSQRLDVHIGKHIGAELRAAREAAGLSQDAAAKRVGMHRANWTRLERGIHTPQLTTIIIAFLAVNASPSEFIERLLATPYDG